MRQEKTQYFKAFGAEVNDISLPEKFTFPFYYEPHPLAVRATELLKAYLKNQQEWEYDFGLEDENSEEAQGKMFGVLVVKNEQGELGFLSAFSGKLAGVNHLSGFVPPVFDILKEGDFYRVGEEELRVITEKLEEALIAPEYLEAKAFLAKIKKQAAKEIEAQRLKNQELKKKRKQKRKAAAEELNPRKLAVLKEELGKESVGLKYLLKHLRITWEGKLAAAQQTFDKYQNEIDSLREQRRNKSNGLQEQIFKKYDFLNIKGERKNLLEIFQDEATPAGSGDCAAPKLLQFAFLNHYQPLALAEFWWGKSPKSAVRLHEQYYPACRGKCKPILGHMLVGMQVDDNPLLTNPALGKELPTIYEDEHILVVNKPAEFLSAPGIHIQDSVQFRMQVKYPEATGPMIAHRLDMSTSGLMLITKTKEHYTILQRQFMKRKVKKRYTAWLEGIVEGDEGRIDLPLRVDLDNRPQQIICYEYGRRAVTEWKVLERTKNRTKINFYPISGRTHQLRVHAAHPSGLGCPIVGDDIYGKRGERLHLHAEYLEFVHPFTKETMQIECLADF